MTNTEPQGIKDIREAKADYLESLAKVKDAQAKIKEAEAKTEEARAVLQQALAKQQEIANKLAEAEADDEIAKLKREADIAAVEAQKTLAEKQWALEQALRKIAAEAMTLTKEERDAISDAADEYNAKLKAYNKAYNALVKAEQKLWSAEYDEEVAPTDTGYMLEIAAYEAKIAQAELQIATTEGLLEEPQEVKDSIDAWEARIKDLQIDTVNASNAKRIYEATTLKDANRAYKALLDSYVADSIPAKTPFKFYQAFPLTNGKGLDARFAFYVNKGIKDEAGKTTKDFGIQVDGKEIKVGKIGSDYATKEDLDTARAYLAEIVEALNRDLVVIEDLKDSTDIAKAQAKAKEADSTYKAHRAILEKGIAKFQPLLDSQAVVKAKDSALTVAKAVLKQKEATLASDSAAFMAALKVNAKELVDAAEAFAKITNKIVALDNVWYMTSGNDSTDFVKAAIALGKAKAKYFGVQDSIPLHEVDREGVDKTYGVPFSKLDPKGFVTTFWALGVGQATSLYGGEGYGRYYGSSIGDLNQKAQYWGKGIKLGRISYFEPSDKGDDAFTKVVRIATGKTNFAWGDPIKAADVLYKGEFYVKESPIAYNAGSFAGKDTVAWYKHFVGNEATADKKGDLTKVATKAKLDQIDSSNVAVANATQDTVAAYKAVVAAKGGVTKAENAYKAIYKSFWGVNNYETPERKINWSDAAFSTPEQCVVFDYNPLNFENDRHIIDNNALRIVLDGLEGNLDYSSGAKSVDYGSHILWGGDESGRNGKRTEFALSIFWAQVADDLGSYESRKEQLKNINAQKAAIDTAVVKYAAENEAKNAARTAAIKKLTGSKMSAKVDELSEACVENGKWNLKGLQKEWAEQFAPEYPEICAEVAFAQETTKELIEDAQAFIGELDYCYTLYYNVVNDKKEANLDAIFKHLNREIEKQNNKIAHYNDRIADLKKALAKYEAGYDRKQLYLESLQQEVDKLTKMLAQAEEKLKIAEKEYNDIIKKYGVNE